MKTKNNEQDFNETLIKHFCKEEKLRLLRDYFNDDVYTKAIIDTLSDAELEKWINDNIETLIYTRQAREIEEENQIEIMIENNIEEDRIIKHGEILI